MEKFLCPNDPLRCYITGLSECGKSYFLKNLILRYINDFEKIYIHSPSLHQDLLRKIVNCFDN